MLSILTWLVNPSLLSCCIASWCSLWWDRMTSDTQTCSQNAQLDSSLQTPEDSCQLSHGGVSLQFEEYEMPQKKLLSSARGFAAVWACPQRPHCRRGGRKVNKAEQLPYIWNDTWVAGCWKCWSLELLVQFLNILFFNEALEAKAALLKADTM